MMYHIMWGVCACAHVHVHVQVHVCHVYSCCVHVPYAFMFMCTDFCPPARVQFVHTFSMTQMFDVFIQQQQKVCLRSPPPVVGRQAAGMALAARCNELAGFFFPLFFSFRFGFGGYLSSLLNHHRLPPTHTHHMHYIHISHVYTIPPTICYTCTAGRVW